MAVSDLNGKIYSRLIPNHEVQLYRVKFDVISTQLKAGSLQVRIFSESDPGDGFVQAVPSLEDVYFKNVGIKADISIA